jgi:aminoglycoside phosphotransferase (APT) family kinase protein
MMNSEREARVLRRVDWRYLLPAPLGRSFDHLVIPGADEAIRGALEARGVATRVTADLAAAEGADCVAIEAEAESPPFGALRRALCSLRRVLHSLRRQGFVITGTYWVRPDFRRRQAYVPLDRKALGWYLATSTDATTPMGWVRARVLRRIDAVSSALARASIDRFAITASLGEPDGRLLSPFEAVAGIDGLGDPSLRPVMITNGFGDLNRVVLLPFGPRDRQPRAVVKLGRLPERNPLYEAEQNALVTLRTMLTPEVADALPRSLGGGRAGDQFVGAETFLPGRSLGAPGGRWRAPLRRGIEDFELASRWITEFHRQAVVSTLWTEAEQREWVEAPIEQYLGAYVAGGEERALLEAARRCFASQLGRRLPIVWQHYAYAPWNIVREGGRIRVFDWEGASPGLPLMDLLYLTVHWYQDVRHAADEESRLEVFGTLLGPPGGHGSAEGAAHRAIDRYLERMGLAPDLLGAGWTLFWVQRCLSERAREAAGAGSGVTLRQRYLQTLADRIDHLFPGGAAAGARPGARGGGGACGGAESVLLVREG